MSFDTVNGQTGNTTHDRKERVLAAHDSDKFQRRPRSHTVQLHSQEILQETKLVTQWEQMVVAGVRAGEVAPQGAWGQWNGSEPDCDVWKGTKKRSSV